MTSMRGDIVNRVRRLPKPTQAAEALQPIFEAVSNSLHAVEDAFGEQYQARGRITVTITNARTPADIEVIVSDNGVGSNPTASRRSAPPIRTTRLRKVERALAACFGWMLFRVSRS